MSYILDALRRADSERERGAVPSLHSKQVSAGLADADDDETSGRAGRPLWWAVGLLALALAGVLAWVMMGRSAPEPQPMAVAAALPPPPPPPVTQREPTATAGFDAPPVPPLPAPAAVPSPAPAVTPQPHAERRSVAPATPPAQVAAAAKPPAKPPAKAGEKPVERPAAAASPKEDDTPVPSVSELPDDFRRQLPTLSVSGASYSKNPASRMLILNGQVFKEGDKVANDLVLEQIRLKSAVLSYRGRRYSISF